jgi:1,4-dihydroxy-6-naphthoate synthase
VTRPGVASKLGDLRDLRVAIPGERTTAFMLLQLALGSRPQTTEMRFDAIIPAVARGEVDAGLIIHESRFTYQNAGLVSVADLGDWWETVTGMPIPLGAILARNDLGAERARAIDDAIRASLQFARTNPEAIMPFVREHAFEMSDDVMRKHIELYVNDYSSDIGEDGITAVNELFARARAAAILQADAAPHFS